MIIESARDRQRELCTKQQQELTLSSQLNSVYIYHTTEHKTLSGAAEACTQEMNIQYPVDTTCCVNYYDSTINECIDGVIHSMATRRMCTIPL